MKKKLLSLFMACAMILALAVPAFADNYNVNEEGNVSEDLTQTVTIATRTFVPTVKLTLPTMTEPSVVLNPYKISFTGDEQLLNGYAVADANNADQAKQVISPVYFIKNETDVKLNYTVAVTGTVEGGVTFSNDAVSLTEKNKKAHVALMVANKGISSATDVSIATTATQDILAASLGLTKADIETQYLKAAEVKFTAPKSLDDAKTTPNYLAFQFKGDLTRQPTPNAWTADDKVGAVITFTFTPESAQDFEITSDVSMLSGGAIVKGTGAITTFTPVDPTGGTVPATWKVNATPAWQMVNAGKYGATINASTGEISLSITELAKAPGLSTTAADFTDTIVIAFNDEDGVPRTVKVPIKMNMASAA